MPGVLMRARLIDAALGRKDEQSARATAIELPPIYQRSTNGGGAREVHGRNLRLVGEKDLQSKKQKIESTRKSRVP